MKASSNKPAAVDQKRRGIETRIALAASHFDTPEMAVQICRDLNEIFESGDYALVMKTDAPAKRAASFSGRPMTSRFPGRCAVCGGGITEGEPILYDRDSRRAAHERCGEVSE